MNTRATQYERIASILRFLDENRAEQPDLEAIAAHVGMDRFEVHRQFRAFAGVTPKDFLQCLTLEHCRRLLQGGESVLDAALDSGLSGPSRLHDLCVGLEAATPGELKSRGEGLTMQAGFASTPFGDALIGSTPRGICHFSFVESTTRRSGEAQLADWSRARFAWDDGVAQEIADRVFTRTTARTGLRAYVRGTAFQVRVWRALLSIPEGSLTSYGRIARAIGEPKASRAVGAAVGANAIAVLIPCHRVIRETGVLGEYRWGAARKRALVAWETAAQSKEPRG